jgi:hypothetical protein
MKKAKPHSNADRKSSSAPLSAKLNRKLFAYAAAASAAGVTLLAQPAEGKVVYTAANIPLSSDRNYALDLNNDGIRDLILVVFQYEGYGLDALSPKVQPQNAILGTSRFAAALSSGVTVGPGGNFRAGWVDMEDESCRSGCSAFGPWANAQGKYLGVSFLINGEVHYGWVRLNVNGYAIHTSAVTGYAYETEPNTAIVTGQTDGAEKAAPRASAPEILPTPQPASLGMLALGAPSLNLWRKGEE